MVGVSDENRRLIRRFGFNSPDKAQRERLRQRHMQRVTSELNRRALKHAWALAHRNTHAEDKIRAERAARKGQKADPKRALQKQQMRQKQQASSLKVLEKHKIASKVNYNRKMQRATPQEKAMLKTAWKARIKVQRQHKQKTSMMRKSARGGKLRSHNVNPAMEAEAATRKRVAMAASNLVGAVQDLMALSGTSLSIAVHNIATRYAQKYGKVIAQAVATKAGTLAGLPPYLTAVVTAFMPEQASHGAGKFAAFIASPALRGGSVVITLTPAWLYAWMLSLVVDRTGLRNTSSKDAKRRWDRVSSETKGIIAGILGRKKTDLKPLVNAFIMSLDAGEVNRLGHAMIKYVLDNYVDKPYKSSSEGEGTMCKLCREVGPLCSRRANGSRKMNVDKDLNTKLKQILIRVLNALNMLLKLENKNVTQVLRTAVDSNLPGFLQAGLVQRGAAFVIGSQVTQWILGPFHDKISKILQRYGLGITQDDLKALVNRHLGTIGQFVKHKVIPKDVSIERVLIDIVVHSKPLHLVHGLRGAALGSKVNAASSRAFCALCGSMSCAA